MHEGVNNEIDAMGLCVSPEGVPVVGEGEGHTDNQRLVGGLEIQLIWGK